MIWRKTKEFDQISVSDEGQVRNDLNGFIYKSTINKFGYCVITGPDRRQYRIHRLVAMAFQDICGLYCDNMVIDHINGIKSDNRACNLRWTTQKGNMNNPITVKKLSESKKGDNNPMKRKDVSMKSALWKVGRHLSDEHRKKISDSNKGKVRNEQTKRLLSINASKRKRNNKGQFDYA